MELRVMHAKMYARCIRWGGSAAYRVEGKDGPPGRLRKGCNWGGGKQKTGAMIRQVAVGVERHRPRLLEDGEVEARGSP